MTASVQQSLFVENRQSDPKALVSVLLSRWVAPMDGPLLENAGVAYSDGIILAIASAKSLRDQYPAASIEDLGDCILLPGLINAHVHLELSALSPGEQPASFVDWLKRLIPPSTPHPQSVQAFVEKSVAEGVRQCLRFGITRVGDISRQCALTRPLLAQGPLNVVSYGEVQAMAQRRGFLEERLAIAVDSRDESDFLRTGISPHAPYSIESHGYTRCLELARSKALPLATHLAETSDEADFLAHHSGPFRDLWNHLQAWDEAVPHFSGGPIRFAANLGLLDYPTLLAHVNYCDDEELSLLAAGQASVVYCPRTHAYFRHPPHRWRDMLSAHVNVAIGTDSCAARLT